MSAGAPGTVGPVSATPDGSTTHTLTIVFGLKPEQLKVKLVPGGPCCGETLHCAALPALTFATGARKTIVRRIPTKTIHCFMFDPCVFVKWENTFLMTHAIVSIK